MKLRLRATSQHCNKTQKKESVSDEKAQTASDSCNALSVSHNKLHNKHLLLPHHDMFTIEIMHYHGFDIFHSMIASDSLQYTQKTGLKDIITTNVLTTE